MKKFGLLVAGIIAAMVLFSTIGTMVGLALCLVVLYVVFKKFKKAESSMRKLVWGVIGLIALAAAANNAPAILGLVAIYVLYVVYKKWNSPKNQEVVESNDPFVNFEKQWNELKQS